jgi:hypothetical protein
MGAHLLQDLPCKNCGKPFKGRSYNYLRGFKIYCSRECYNATRPKGFGKGGMNGYERKIEAEKRNPVQAPARKLLDSAIKRGEAVRHPCFVCREERVEEHNWDYSRPLSVFWLCRRHHVDAHDGVIDQLKRRR